MGDVVVLRWTRTVRGADSRWTARFALASLACLAFAIGAMIVAFTQWRAYSGFTPAGTVAQHVTYVAGVMYIASSVAALAMLLTDLRRRRGENA